MAYKYIDARLMREMINSAAAYLEKNHELINDLNVFPVPDGDTGTNMLATVVSAAKEVNSCPENANVIQIVRAISNGALRGARGNSGVILSQIFRGFTNGIDKNTDKIGSREFADAIDAGVTAAYKAVMRPREGTILSVAKAMAESGRKNDSVDNIELFLSKVIEDGTAMLNKTPDMLPVLKEAGVVDAGGAGLIAIYTGFKMAVSGIKIETTLDLQTKKKENVPVKASAKDDISTANITYGYCNEFFIKKFKDGVNEKNIENLREELLKIGDSLVMVGDTDLLKVHVHSNMPNRVLELALELGELTGIKIENMREQHTELSWADEAKEAEKVKPTKPIGIVAVAAGDGLAEILKELNVDGIVNGGQSMNPSADDIAETVKKVPSNNVIILPNNKNITLAAKQAGELAGKNVHVIHTKSFPQGLASLLAFNEEASFIENVEVMTEAMQNVRSGEVTKAVRDSKLNGEDIIKGEYLGISEGDIVSHKADMFDAVLEMLGTMADEDSSVISVYTGIDSTEAENEKLKTVLEEKYPDCDIEMLEGKQPVYNYIVSVE